MNQDQRTTWGLLARSVENAAARLGRKVDNLASLGKGGELAVAKLIEILDQNTAAYMGMADMLADTKAERDRLLVENTKLRAALIGMGSDVDRILRGD